MAFFISILLLGFLSISKIPDFTSLQIILALVSIPILITSIISRLGLISYLQFLISNINNVDLWIGNEEKKILQQTRTLSKHLDSPLSNYILSLSLFILGIFSFFKGSNLYSAIFGMEYEIVQQNDILIFNSFIGLFFIVSSIIIIYKTIKSQNLLTKIIWDSLIFYKLFRYPKEYYSSGDRDLLNWIDKITTYIQSNQFIPLNYELSSNVYKKIERELEKYFSILKIINENLTGDITKNLDFPGLNISPKTLIQYPDLKSGITYIPLSGVRDIFDNQSFKIFNFEFEISEILFSEDSNVPNLMRHIKNQYYELFGLDFLLFTVFWVFFISAKENGKIQTPEHNHNIKNMQSSNISLSEVLNVESVVFSILYANWIFNNDFEVKNKHKMVRFFFDYNERVEIDFHPRGIIFKKINAIFW